MTPSIQYVRRLGSELSRRDFLKTGLAACAAPLLAGCNIEPLGDPNAGPPADPHLTARPGEPTFTPIVGINSLGTGPLGRALLYVPASYSPDTPAPLFVGLHGAGGSANDWVSYHARAEQRGMVFLAPDSSSHTWDLVSGNFGPDVGLMDRALHYTFEHCRIDPARIALGGFSDGASYALSLGVANGDLFTNLVGYSPGFWRGPAERVGQPAVYISHGTQDTVLPVSLSRDGIVPIMRDRGYDVTYEEFDGGHQVPAAISESALDWFLAVS